MDVELPGDNSMAWVLARVPDGYLLPFLPPKGDKWGEGLCMCVFEKKQLWKNTPEELQDDSV